MEEDDQGFVLSAAFKALVNAPPHHIAIEICLIVYILKLVFSNKSFKAETKEKPLTPQQEEELLAEWKPEPLVPAEPSDDPHMHKQNDRLVHGQAGAKININGKECLNFATFNFLNFIGGEKHHERAIAAIRKYGVGSCGPRGFYLK